MLSCFYFVTERHKQCKSFKSNDLKYYKSYFQHFGFTTWANKIGIVSLKRLYTAYFTWFKAYKQYRQRRLCAL